MPANVNAGEWAFVGSVESAGGESFSFISSATIGSGNNTDISAKRATHTPAVR